MSVTFFVGAMGAPSEPRSSYQCKIHMMEQGHASTDNPSFQSGNKELRGTTFSA